MAEILTSKFLSDNSSSNTATATSFSSWIPERHIPNPIFLPDLLYMSNSFLLANSYTLLGPSK